MTARALVGANSIDRIANPRTQGAVSRKRMVSPEISTLAPAVHQTLASSLNYLNGKDPSTIKRGREAGAGAPVMQITVDTTVAIGKIQKLAMGIGLPVRLMVSLARMGSCKSATTTVPASNAAMTDAPFPRRVSSAVRNTPSMPL